MAVTIVVTIDPKIVIANNSKGSRGVTTPTIANLYCYFSIPSIMSVSYY